MQNRKRHISELNIEPNNNNKKNKTDINIWTPLNKPVKKETDIWISGTSVKNYLLNDPILDWLELFYINRQTKQNKNKIIKQIKQEKANLDILFKSGIEFENEVFKELLFKYPTKAVQVGYTREDVNEANMIKTINYMKKGKEIIIQAVLINKETKMRGLADLMVRSDFINKLFGEIQLSSNESNIPSPLLNKNYHYRIIDIKWMKLNLCSDGKLMRNNNRIPSYKGQLAIYNTLLGNIQGYYPNKAYILGSSWKYEMCKEKYSGFSCFDLLGHIDYEFFDKSFINKTAQAIQWMRNLNTNGKLWTLNPPSVPELYPNMSNTNDSPWHEIKSDIANNIEELTRLWQVGYKNRKIGHTNKIYKISDLNCSADKLGISGSKQKKIINDIIHINTSQTSQISQIITPNIIKNNICNWKNKTKLDFYIDFETISGCFIENEETKSNTLYDNMANSTLSNYIFLIGLGYYKNNKWMFETFHVANLSLKEETRIINLLIDFINKQIAEYKTISKRNTKIIPRLFHWSNAEVSSFNLANKRNDYMWTNWLENIMWTDICKIFMEEPITIKNAYTFKLKDIAKSFYEHKLIKTIWPKNGISSGLGAMMASIDYYNNKNKKIINNIIKYNEIDCKVMAEIIEYLRIYHI
jgi:hypothetical protein